ncbi:5-formyltetrahydrofolate cyclo-ligase [Corynebacterium sp. 3HC-13]|uniref:5-formyltetrahydrofolate cyclo-ligase n=1 Tax=Corynebacterium poyangense TaxID=2684405 RepID=UPI001CCEF4A4|nr:5-formyltetrahydrofolate cyclo-ligase [Corynebacterium poyangense]MBZ8176287.1 5-formyltetrahydrofolate cyclo-ligase [Corynebacterium poyangense]
MNSSEAKKQLRRQCQQKRIELSTHPELLEQLNKELCEQLASFLDDHRCKAVAAYSPTVVEPGGDVLLDFLRHEVSEIWLPISQPRGVLEWAHYDPSELLRPGKLGIMEPTGPRISTEQLQHCDVFFIPALACHPTGIRLGQGAGYYDRALSYLSQRSHPPLTVALLHPGEISTKVPIEPHDQPVQCILTAKGTIPMPIESV